MVSTLILCALLALIYNELTRTPQLVKEAQEEHSQQVEILSPDQKNPEERTYRDANHQAPAMPQAPAATATAENANSENPANAIEAAAVSNIPAVQSENNKPKATANNTHSIQNETANNENSAKEASTVQESNAANQNAPAAASVKQTPETNIAAPKSEAPKTAPAENKKPANQSNSTNAIDELF